MTQHPKGAELVAQLEAALVKCCGHSPWAPSAAGDLQELEAAHNAIIALIDDPVRAAGPELLGALRVLAEEAASFNVNGVYFGGACMGHKGLDMAEAAMSKAKATTPGETAHADGAAHLIGRGVVQVLSRGRGETPPCPAAKFQRGDVVKVRRNSAVGHFPRELVVMVAVPPGVSPDDALADLLGEPRSLMTRVGSRSITYILCREGDPTTYRCFERHLLPSGKPRVDIGNIAAVEAQA